MMVYKLIIVVCLWSVSVAAHSQASNGGSIGIGESDLFPSIRFEYSQDSNAFRQDTNELENNSIVVSPELLWSADRGQTSLTLNYSCLLYTSPSPRDATLSRMPSSA